MLKTRAGSPLRDRRALCSLGDMRAAEMHHALVSNTRGTYAHVDNEPKQVLRNHMWGGHNSRSNKVQRCVPAIDPACKRTYRFLPHNKNHALDMCQRTQDMQAHRRQTLDKCTKSKAIASTHARLLGR